MLRDFALVALVPLVSGQMPNKSVGCVRRIAFDLAKDTNPAIAIEWTSATDPAGTVYIPNQDGACTTGLASSGSSGPSCPTDGVPYGQGGDPNVDNFYGTNAIGPFMDHATQGGGAIRIKNVAIDYKNNNRPVDMFLTVPPRDNMTVYSSTITMGYSSIVMPWNNDVPATQFRLLPSGLLGVGFGLLPSKCPTLNNALVSAAIPFCDNNPNLEPQGYGTEFRGDFIYGDTFTWTSYDIVDPPIEGVDVIFWDVDGDRVQNGLGAGSPLNDIAGVPPVAQDAGNVFPQSIAFEEALEIQSVKDASKVIFTGSSIAAGFFSSTGIGNVYISGTAPVNNPTNLLVNPYEDLTAFSDPRNEPAIGIYRNRDITTFNILVAGISAVGRQYRTNGQPWNLDASVSPKRQNDRGYFFSIMSPEPVCTCADACPAECADVTTAPSYCARNPNCACPDSCKVVGAPAECGGSATCPSVACPAECAPAHPLRGYYAYCKTNPNCPCPNECSLCSATVTPGCDPAQNADCQSCDYECPGYVSCSLAPAATCAKPSPPPFPPPFPPLPCLGWCTANTCGNEECKGCSTCETVAAGNYCAGWCNAYTCASEHELCQGCSVCSAPTSSATCHSWCSAYTCFGQCSSCSVCGQVAAGSYCASWCNAYTCGGLFTGLCGGCSECSEVSSNSYCASWCNAYTCGGIFSGLCGGCSTCV